MDTFSSPPYGALTPFDGASLVDEQALPGWLRGSNETEPLPLPFTVSNSIGGPARPRIELSKEQAAAQPARPGGANEEEALPDWLRQVYADAQVPSLPEPQQPGNPASKGQLSGSDLLDERSIPKWLEEASQTSPLPDFPKEALWATPPQPASAGPAAQATHSDTPQPAGAFGPLGFSGQSLIDDASLPEWLRNMDPGSPPTIGASRKSLSGPAQPASQPFGSPSGIFSAAELVDTQSLPAWLKPDATPTTDAGSGTGPSGKASDAASKSGPAGSASGIFSAAELVDTQSLPTWLRTEEEAKPPTKTGQPTPASGPSGSASGIFSATELVNTQSLPAWLRIDASETAPGQEGQPDKRTGSSASPSGIFSAAELVDTQSLPTWLKAEDQPDQTTSAPIASDNTDWKGSSSKLAAIPTGFSTQKTGGFSAAELVDGDSLPAWLKGAVADPSASQAGQSSPARQTAGQMSGAELVDTQSLPAWMKETGPGAAFSPASSRSGAERPQAEVASTASGQTGGFSAASLVDPEALPEWLRAAQSSEAPGQSQRGSDQLAGQSWSQPMPSAEHHQSDQSSLSGASLIDQEQLPDWIRNPTSLQRDNGQQEGPHARVPRRPHLSIEPNRAPSQAAANVFSSVLGPSAGEESQGKQPNKRQSGEWGGQEMPPAAQRNPGQSKPQRGGSEGAPGVSGSSADWQNYRAGMAAPQDGRGMGARSGGLKPPPQSAWQGAPSGEWGNAQGPSDLQGNQAMPNAAFGMSGNAPPDSYGAGPAGAYGQGPQRRGLSQSPNAGAEQSGWENIPSGYGQGFSYDDDVGPPSGVFAKIKRMLGFGR